MALLHYSVLEIQTETPRINPTTAKLESNTEYTLEQQRRDSKFQLLLMMFIPLYLVAVTGILLRAFYFPTYPSFTVVVGSARHVSDRYVTSDVIELGVAIEGSPTKDMSLRDVTLTAFQSGENRRFSATATHPPFEIKGLDRGMEWFRVENATFSVDSYGISKISATIRAKVKCRSIVWPFEQESSMRAQCHNLEVINSNNSFKSLKAIVQCDSYGSWDLHLKLFSLITVPGSCAISLFLTIYIRWIYKRNSSSTK